MFPSITITMRSIWEIIISMELARSTCRSSYDNKCTEPRLSSTVNNIPKTLKNRPKILTTIYGTNAPNWHQRKFIITYTSITIIITMTITLFKFFIIFFFYIVTILYLCLCFTSVFTMRDILGQQNQLLFLFYSNNTFASNLFFNLSRKTN